MIDRNLADKSEQLIVRIPGKLSVTLTPPIYQSIKYLPPDSAVSVHLWSSSKLAAWTLICHVVTQDFR